MLILVKGKHKGPVLAIALLARVKLVSISV